MIYRTFLSGALALLAAPLAAQSVEQYRLPGATTTPAPPTAQGPVDPAEPAVRRSVPPSPSPTPEPAPTATLPASTPSPAARAPAPARAAPVARPAVRPVATATPEPTASAPVAVPSALPLPAAVPEPATAQPLTGYWPWLAAASALIAAMFALLWWRSRRQVPGVVTFERPAAAPAPEPSPQPAAPGPASADLVIALEARRLTASMMATTLSYRLRVTNRGTARLETLAIEGDMVAAHASLPPERQIASHDERLELRHALVALAPGESAEFSGDLRLPLSAITPIRAGEVPYFVPLARLRIEASDPVGTALVTAQTFVIGEAPDTPGAALRPFRLDLGPRTYSRIGQRAVG